VLASRSRRTGRLVTAARGGLLGFVGLVALEHVLRPGLAPADHFVSEYSRGWTQPIQVAAFLAWAAGTAACTLLAARANPARPIARALVTLGLAAATVGLLMAAAFTTQTVAGELPAGVERSLGGQLHDLGTLFILAGLLFSALASLRLVADNRYRALVALLGFALIAIVPALVAVGWDAPGVGQRGFILVGIAWQWAFTARAER
jgi:hypothetical protein